LAHLSESEAADKTIGALDQRPKQLNKSVGPAFRTRCNREHERRNRSEKKAAGNGNGDPRSTDIAVDYRTKNRSIITRQLVRSFGRRVKQ
jgi:hypothetical protein